MPEELNKKIIVETPLEPRPETSIDDVVPEAVRDGVNRSVEGRLIEVGGTINKDGNGVPLVVESNAPLYKHEVPGEVPMAAQSSELPAGAADLTLPLVGKKVEEVFAGKLDPSEMENTPANELMNSILEQIGSDKSE